MQLPRPSDHPKTSALVGGTGASAVLFAILRELDPRWIPYIAIGAFFLVALLATFLFLLFRQRRMWRGYDPEGSGPSHYPNRYPDTAIGAHFAALDAARDREVVNFIAGTLTALAGMALAVYLAATRVGIFAPIFVGILTSVFAGFYFFSYRSVELHRRRLEAHNVYLLALSDFVGRLSREVPEQELAKVHAQILANIAAASPTRETTQRSGGLRRQDLKAAIDMIRAAAGLTTDSGGRSD